jgi:hypothetical protein
MKNLCFTSVAAIAVGLLALPALAQTAAATSESATAATVPPRTPWGAPDLQGTWDYRTITPLERPRGLEDREFFTEEEVVAREATAAARLDGPPQEGDLVIIHAPYWTDAGRYLLEDGRTSLVVDPPDGRVPSLTSEAVVRQAANRPPARPDSYEDRSPYERCITRGLPQAILPGLYNNNIHIVQTPGYVAVVHEMVHETRIIPVDGRSHRPSGLRTWFGDSRGRWDGETLVVETTNFSGRMPFRGAGENLRIVERFTRLDADTLGYEITFDDPTTWSRSWTAAYPMRPSEGPIYEYACHEGNYGLANILEVARDEREAEVAAKSGQRPDEGR